MRKIVFFALIAFLASSIAVYFLPKEYVSAAIPSNLWEAQGRTLVSNVNWIEETANTSDGNYVVATMTDSGVFVQKFNTSGTALWAGSGVKIEYTSDSFLYSTFANDTSGNIAIFWFSPNQGVYMQKLDLDGNVLLSSGGVSVIDLVYAPLNVFKSFNVAQANTGGFFLSWAIWTSNTNVTNSYIQHIDSSGTKLWGASGIAVDTSATGNQLTPEIFPDGSGGVLLTWDNNVGIYTNRMDSAGNKIWNAYGNTLTNTCRKGKATIGPDHSLYIAQLSSTTYLQKVNLSGVAAWSGCGVTVGTPATAAPEKIDVEVDSSGSAFIAWTYYISGDNVDIKGQKVLSDGSLAWSGSGIPLISNETHEETFSVKIFPDNSGGMFLTSESYQIPVDTQPYKNVFVQHISSDGTYSLPSGENAAMIFVHGQGAFPLLSANNEIFLVWRDIASYSAKAKLYTAKYQVYNMQSELDAENSSFINAEREGPSPRVRVVSEETFNLPNSPLGNAYNSDTYLENGWTQLGIANSFDYVQVTVNMTIHSDRYPEELFVYLEAPGGTTKTVFEGAVLEDNESTPIEVTLTFAESIEAGNWKLWLYDDYGDGGCSATNVSITFKSMEGPDTTPPTLNSDTYNLTNGSGSYTWDTYNDNGWTTFTSSRAYNYVQARVQFNYNADENPDEGYVFLQSPNGSVRPVFNDQYLVDNTVTPVDVTIDFMENTPIGTWRLWVFDDVGDGGNYLTNVQVTLSDSAGPASAYTTGFIGTETQMRVANHLEDCYIGEFASVLFNSDLDWSALEAACDKSAYKSFSKDHSLLPGVTGEFSLLVPKGADHNTVRFCPVSSLTEVTSSCAGSSTFTTSSIESFTPSLVGVTTVTIDGQDYWKVPNVSDGGAISLITAQAPVNPDPEPPVTPPVTPPPSTPTTKYGTGDAVQLVSITKNTEEYGDNYVIVCWETNVDTSAKFEYGANKGTATIFDNVIDIAEYNTQHCVTLNNFDKNETNYKYKITATSLTGQKATLEKAFNMTLKDSLPLTGGEINIVSIKTDLDVSQTDSDISISYTTQYPSTCVVNYGTSLDNLRFKYNNDTLNTSHIAYLSTQDFPAGSDVYYQIDCTMYDPDQEDPIQLVKSGFIAKATLETQDREGRVDSSYTDEFAALLVTGAILASTATLFAYPNSVIYAVAWIRNRKKLRPWGIVFDPSDNSPVPFAVVELYKDGVFIQKTVTDTRGRYIFPVVPGDYTIIAQQSGYNQYKTQLTISEQRTVNHDIALKKTSRSSLVYTLRKLLPKINKYIFIIGLIVAAILTIFYFNTVNLIIFGIYAIQVVTWFMLRQPKGIGKVINSSNRQPVKGAIVKIHETDTLSILDSQMTTSDGSYSTILDSGKYLISIEGNGYKFDEANAGRLQTVVIQGKSYISAVIDKNQQLDMVIPVVKYYTGGFTQ